jgi:type VI protein secretion system component VasA
MNRDEIEAEKKRLKAEYGNLFDSIAEILFRHDPVGINFDDNTDEYEPEARTILPRLKDCHSVEDVITIVHEEFQRCFDPGFAEPKQKYRKIAEEIWLLWQRPQRQLQ